MPAESAISRAVGRACPVLTRSSTAPTTESRVRSARADRPSTVWVLVIGRHRRCRCTARATTGPMAPLLAGRRSGGAGPRPQLGLQDLAGGVQRELLHDLHMAWGLE